MVARSPRLKCLTPSPKNSRYADTTRCSRRNSVIAKTISVAVIPAGHLPVSLTPMMSGKRIMEGRPNITFSASKPPTPMAITPKASTWGVCESVPTQVSGKATPSRIWITGDIFSRLIWCMMPFPAGITSTLRKAFLHQLIK